MMDAKTVTVFLISMLWTGLVFARQNFLYDFKEVTMPIDAGVISFRLFGTNRMENQPKKVRFRSNPYTLSIRYIADVPFTHASISGLEFVSRNENKLIFENVEKVSSRSGGADEAGYAGFYYGDLSKAIELDYIDYLVKGTMTIYGSGEKSIVVPFEAVFEADYKEKTTWDFWEGIMGI